MYIHCSHVMSDLVDRIDYTASRVDIIDYTASRVDIHN